MTLRAEKPVPMHAEDRERLILDAMMVRGFVTYRALDAALAASPATIRRDLSRLEDQGKIARVRGGAKLVVADATSSTLLSPRRLLIGMPFEQAIGERLEQKRAIGRMAAGLCAPGEGIMIDGGTTTLQMCQHLDGLNLQVLTNSLHIVSALLPQDGTRILVPSGTVFREQNIILAPAGDDSMPRFYAPKLFLGAAAVGSGGVMQADTILVTAERQLIDRADQVILLVDSSKFSPSSGAVVCGLDKIDVIVTDDQLSDTDAEMVKSFGVRLLLAGNTV